MTSDNPENDFEDDFEPATNQDAEAMESVVLAAAIEGNELVREWTLAHVDVLDEPYRTVALCLKDQVAAGQYVDRHTIGSHLGTYPLARFASTGRMETLNSVQVLNLIFAGEVQAGQAEAYLAVLTEIYRSRLLKEYRQQAEAIVKEFGEQPDRLIEEMNRLGRGAGAPESQRHPSELMELVPYMQGLVNSQTGAEFLGVDSGFQHLNNICNGLNTGLIILAAPPSAGKTTWAWQVACQVAELNPVPVIFVSLEQSKPDLRAKALTRLSNLEYRHILRGRLNNDDEAQVGKLLEAGTRYGLIANRLTIIEGDGKTIVESIRREAIAKMKEANAARCLIVLDYLQILPLQQEHTSRVNSAKDRVDLHVSELRRIGRELNSPVLAISSENRAGYRSKGMDVFKESGAIEYSADVAMILGRDKKSPPLPGRDHHDMVLEIIKNRNGERGVVKFKFYPAKARFAESGKCDFVEEEDA